VKLINDIKKDLNFKNNFKIVSTLIITFFICDFILGIGIEKGLEKYYGLNTTAEIALVGHSHLMLGINKVKVEESLNVKVSKYTREGVNISDRQIMIDQLLRKNNSIKTIIYGVDAWSFTGEGLSANSYTLFYPFLADANVNAYVKKKSSFTEYWLHKLIKTTRFNEGLISSSIRGYLSNWSNLKFGEVDTIRLKEEIKVGKFRKINTKIENIEILRESIKVLGLKNIQIILLYVPTIDLYNTAEISKFNESITIFENLEKEFKHVKYISFLEPWSHQYSIFHDPIHLNPKGQDLITLELIKKIK